MVIRNDENSATQTNRNYRKGLLVLIKLPLPHDYCVRLVPCVFEWLICFEVCCSYAIRQHVATPSKTCLLKNVFFVFSPKLNSNHTNPTLETFWKLFPLICCRTLPLFYIPCLQVHHLIYVRKEVKPTQTSNYTSKGLPGDTKRHQIYTSFQWRGKEVFTPNKYAMLVGKHNMLHSNVKVQRLQTWII
jgi:hypothetical protein